MRFRLRTLIDITETGQHRGPDKLAADQQANFNSLIQVIGLRANPTPLVCNPVRGPITKLGFGSNYKGENSYWEFDFEIEYGETQIETLIEDFQMVPVITGLKETIQLEIPVFETKCSKKRNIVFEKID